MNHLALAADTPTSSYADTAGKLPGWAHHVRLPGGQVIREARPDEYTAAEDLLVAAFTTGCWVSEGYEQGLRRLGQRAEAWHIWVAVDAQDHLLGIVLTPKVEFWTPEHFTFSVLAVGPDGRGLGLGAALTNHAIALARAYGFQVIQINSSPQMSAAHRLYYAEGFVRRPERETAFVSPYDERLLTFTYHVPDPLPESQVIHVERRPGPSGGPPFWREPNKSLWPDHPAGAVDVSGAFVPAAPPADAVRRAERIITRLAAQGLLAEQTTSPATEQPVASADGGPDEPLIKQIVADLGVGALTALWSPEPEARTAAVRVFFARLDALNRRLAANGPFLGGERPGRADVYLFSLLLSYDLGWRAGFAGFGAVADWPHVWHQARLVLGLAALTPEELEAAGLLPNAQGSYAEPFGPLPQPEGLGDVRAGWLEPPAELRRRRPPRDPSVPVLPYPGDWPGQDLQAARAALDTAAQKVALARQTTPQSATRPKNQAGNSGADLAEGRSDDLAGVLAVDLLGSLEELLSTAEPIATLAIWRLFWARVDWLNARFKGRRFLAGDEPGPADQALAAILDAYPADLRDFPRLQHRTNPNGNGDGTYFPREIGTVPISE
ncbi:MAG: GNAT family N-acetyltransferase [Bifidobacteriaceae bacterium]|jgi:putative glutathione S-transferase|nr:GNAT family N-acetyltransferase [Bifidobacteriaceae bacterium]